MTKRQLIDDIESRVKLRKQFQGLSFIPYSENHKRALEKESFESLQQDLKLVTKQLIRAKEEFELQDISFE